MNRWRHTAKYPKQVIPMASVVDRKNGFMVSDPIAEEFQPINISCQRVGLFTGRKSSANHLVPESFSSLRCSGIGKKGY